MSARGWRLPAVDSISLRGQVTVMFALAALAISVVLGVSTASLAYPVMLEQRERTADRQAAINARIVERALLTSSTALDNTLRSLDRPIASYSLVFVDGRWYASRVTADENDLPTSLRQAAITGQAASARTRLSTGPSLVNVRPLADGTAGYIEVFSLADIDQTMQVLVLVLIGVGTITTVAGVAVGRWAVVAALRPVDALTRAAAAVAAGDLTAAVAGGRAADLRALADAFNRTVAALRRRIEQDERFAANVSHELRTPLMTIVNAVELLRARRGSLPPPTGEVVDLLTDEVHRFQRTVIDLLEISTAGEGPFGTERFPVSEVIQVADSIAGGAVTEIPASDRDPVIVGDRRRLERVVANLVDNAEQHAGGVVRVAVEEVGGTVRLVVDDAGPGVPVDQRTRIFERFTRVARSGTGGTGLGLALVAEHVRRHGGRVWVEDRPAGGARFVVELPVEAQAARLSLSDSAGAVRGSEK